MERKEAIEIIKKNWPDSSFTMLREALETLIPELKKSEDERIRIALYLFVEAYGAHANYEVTKEEMLAWLKKQGEQDNNEDSKILQRFSFYSYKDEPNILYLSGVYVNEEFRNKGIGTKILEVADEVAKILDCHTIRLKTKKESDAERLYKTHGYNSLAIEGRDEIWLEKHGELIGDTDTVDSNEDGLIAATIEYANKVEPKFKVGDKVKSIIDGFECAIESIDDTCYYGDTTNFDIQDQDGWELVEPNTVEWSEEDESHG